VFPSGIELSEQVTVITILPVILATFRAAEALYFRRITTTVRNKYLEAVQTTKWRSISNNFVII
jgi:hypothetical protein